MLDTTQEGSEEMKQFPSQMCPHGITNQRQWKERISSTMVREQWGGVETIDKAGEKASRMAWTPGEDAISSSPQDMPVWMVKRYLKAVGCDGSWYSAEQHRGKWREAWSQGMSEHQQAQEARRLEAEKNVVCTKCGRCFRREGTPQMYC